MPNRSKDELFQLVKSLGKNDKRMVKMYMKRASGSEDLKIMRLFDAVDKLDDYDEALLLGKCRGITKQQLPNLKAYLYKQLLAGLRQVRDEDSIELQLNEQMGYARIL